MGRWTKDRAPVRSFSADLAAHTNVGRHYLGTVAVPVHQIVGSVGRAHELGSNFLPLRTSWGLPRADARYRWVKKAMEQDGDFDLYEVHGVTGRYSHGEYEAKRGTILPPIELYRLDDRYYVVDGHHRVAAALSLGQLEMDAVVTEYTSIQATQVTTPAA
jgi:ParB-like nuclease domain